MRIYANGCSLTYGDELEDPTSQSWPVLIAKKIGAELKNDAVSGGTNQRIMYRAIQAINDYDFFIFAWTNYARFTEYNPVDNFEINFTPQLNIDVSLHLSNDLKENYKKYHDDGKMYYRHWFNELYQFKQWLQQIILLQSFLKQHNKRYIMMNAVHNNLSDWLSPRNEFISRVSTMLDFFDLLSDDLLLEEHQKIQDLLSMIDQSSFLEFNTWCINDVNDQFPYGTGGHPLEDGHIAVADKVIDFYNKKYV